MEWSYAVGWLRRTTVERRYLVASAIAMSVGIGANGAIFSFLVTTLIDPLPVQEPGTLVAPHTVWPGGLFNNFSHSQYLALAAARSYSQLAASGSLTVSVRAEGEPLEVTAAFVSDGYFETLGVRATAGRVSFGSSGAVVVSERLARRLLVQDALGTTLRVNRRPFSVTGTVPATFRGLDLSNPVDLYLPLHAVVELTGQRVNYLGVREGGPEPPWLSLVGRLREGASPGSAEAECNAALANLAGARQRTATSPVLVVLPARSTTVSPETRLELRRVGVALVVSAGLMLAAACLAVLAVHVSRLLNRRREMSVRFALGASRTTLLLRSIGEAVPSMLLASGLGVLTMLAVSQALTGYDLPGVKEGRTLSEALNWWSYSLAAATGAAIGLATAALPLFALTEHSLAGALKEVREVPRPYRRLRRVALVSQIGVSAGLLVAGGVLSEVADTALRSELGFDTANRVVLTTRPYAAGYGASETRDLLEGLRERLSRVEGVVQAGVGSNRFGRGGSSAPRVQVDGIERSPSRPVLLNFVGPGYLQGAGLELATGRSIAEGDGRGAEMVAMVDEQAAKVFWPGQQPLGHRFVLPGSEPKEYRVVGVVKSAKYLSLTEPPRSCIYLAYGQHPQSWPNLTHVAVEHRPGAGDIIGMLRRETMLVDADLPVDVTRLSDLVRDQLEPQRLAALLFSLFGLAAIVLGGIGVWGLVTEETTARRRELGIMAAIGATPVQLALSVARATGRLVALGFLLGTAGGVVVARLLSHLLSGLPPVPWAAVISTVAVIVLAAWLPAHVPVWRITRGQPADLIREH